MNIASNLHEDGTTIPLGFTAVIYSAITLLDGITVFSLCRKGTIMVSKVKLNAITVAQTRPVTRT